MTKAKKLIIVLILLAGYSDTFPQTGESDLKIFGYFQTLFRNHQDSEDNNIDNTFNLQQLNLFFQKDLAKNYSAFLNFELLNSYSSFLDWGAFNIEEAWVQYRRSRQFKVKAGLLIPTFNNMNEIKNRTPLLPYIFRPIAYETSFIEEFPLEEFAPPRAFLQVSGFLPEKWGKLDYAVFLGNSPNINNQSFKGQTGVDTTNSVLVGGRLGVRIKEFKCGISFTYDKVKYFEAYHMVFGNMFSELDEIRRIRAGFDLSFKYKKFSFEMETTAVDYDEGTEYFDLDKKFAYNTISYNITDKLLCYATYNYMDAKVLPLFEQSFTSNYLGLAYNLNERIVLKAQWGEVNWNNEALDQYGKKRQHKGDEYYSGVACSVYF